MSFKGETNLLVEHHINIANTVRTQDVAPGVTNRARYAESTEKSAANGEQLLDRLRGDIQAGRDIRTQRITNKSVDGNPTIPGSGGTQRVDNSRGILRLRANTGSSSYHSLQTSIEKRFSKGYQFSAHYTWSTFIDDQSEIFNASVSGEVAVSQDSYNRRAEKGRSTYDRPHRFSVNGIYEVPFGRDTKRPVSHVIGGWQLGGFVTFQSGAPFSPIAGNDPGFRLSGIDSLIGNALRPHVATNLDIASQSVEQLFAVRSTLYSPLSAANPIGNAGRNIMRADGIANVDMVINKKIRLPFERHAMNFRAEFYNLANSRDFGIPNATFSSAAFLNQWNTNGGGRRIVMLLRYQF